tara:strand:- start:75 stop:491 length:417 start_codon:yes stop_codon:yes gene_type:complete
MNEDDIYGALDNDENESIMKLTSSKIKQYKNDILQKLQLKGKDLKEIHKKLKEYRYCVDMRDIRYGFFIRWISLKNPDKIKLTNGAWVADILLYKDGIQVLLTNKNRIFKIKFDECIIFQKLSAQEKIILTVLDYLEK